MEGWREVERLSQSVDPLIDPTDKLKIEDLLTLFKGLYNKI